jgi:glycosyltransferase involved in cell wall biosynthesis
VKEKRLHFSFFPAGAIHTASSRIRVYTFQKMLAEYGIHSTLGYSPRANIFFFQKKVSRKKIWLARMAKAMGKIIIYDVDDSGDDLWAWVSKSHFQKMATIADAVTVCSADQLKILTAESNIGAKAVVIANAIDYFPSAPVKLKHTRHDKLRIVWFGNRRNFGLFEKYVPALLQIPDTEIYAVVGNKYIPDISARQPAVKFLPWNVDNFTSVLQQFDIACLMHDGDVYDRAKGNNKMISAITWGVPAVVSRTPEYERTAKEAGIEDAMFSDEKELAHVIERLRDPAAREKYLQKAQDAIWKLYSPDVIAGQFINLVKKIQLEKK